ncbi:hypothetical protein [Rhizobium sp. RU36D]|uniref:hypothetical protein n=1 Tax=Rhizobium sp. RU36D TaxID=1907415 RepID=UPI0009D7E054|nr:hypothetical protein [Rhizobium sp. RU36D]SMC77076.1 hypothetical protein SAMN05880593_106134 [Rhizobium sp. RU36D]
MFFRRSACSLVVLSLALCAGSAVAGGYERHGDRRHGSESADYRKHHRHDRKDHNAGVTSPNGLPSVVPGIGTYSGAISAVRIKGVGNYFMVSGNLGPADGPILAPKARIIEIQGNNACSYEVGVCVIRP